MKWLVVKKEELAVIQKELAVKREKLVVKRAILEVKRKVGRKTNYPGSKIDRFFWMKSKKLTQIKKECRDINNFSAFFIVSLIFQTSLCCEAAALLLLDPYRLLHC